MLMVKEYIFKNRIFVSFGWRWLVGNLCYRFVLVLGLVGCVYG